jgi:hypothetical protein
VIAVFDRDLDTAFQEASGYSCRVGLVASIAGAGQQARHAFV